MHLYPLTLLAFILLFIAQPTAAANADIRLPEIGSSSASVLSAADEARIGAAMLRKLRRAGRVLDDPLLNDYITRLGMRLVSSTPEAHSDFHFFLINDPSLNAFAMPGGYIGVHTGLIAATRSESELAGVLAHEIAHVTQHHLARGFEKASEMNLPATAAVLAAIILGAHNPQLAQAALAGTLAATEQARLNFTRAHEREADRVGMQILSNAGFDPEGMPAFFERLQEQGRLFDSGIPEFLRTHPVTSARIADSRQRARELPTPMGGDSTEYGLIKARTQVLHDADPARLVAVLEAREALGTGERFSLALARAAAGDHTAARAELQRLLEDAPNHVALHRALGELAYRHGDPAAAISAYREGLALFPGNAPLTLGLAEALIAEGEAAAARARLLQLLRTPHATPIAWRLLAQAEAALGNPGGSNLALGEYYHLLGERERALEQLHQGKRDARTDPATRQRIEARIDAIEPPRKP